MGFGLDRVETEVKTNHGYVLTLLINAHRLIELRLKPNSLRTSFGRLAFLVCRYIFVHDRYGIVTTRIFDNANCSWIGELACGDARLARRDMRLARRHMRLARGDLRLARRDARLARRDMRLARRDVRIAR